jgi:hypothetical protein
VPNVQQRICPIKIAGIFAMFMHRVAAMCLDYASARMEPSSVASGDRMAFLFINLFDVGIVR